MFTTSLINNRWLFCACSVMSDSVGSQRQQPTRIPVPGILQARTLEWVAISFSNAWKWKVKVKSLSRIQLFATPWTAAYQAPPSMGFSRQEYCSGLPFPSPGDLPNPGIELRSPTLQADALTSEPPGKGARSPTLPADSLPAEPQGKPKNTALGSLSLLQRIFLTQESNRGLLHCGRILYQLTELWEKPQEYNLHLWFYYSFSLHLFPSCNTWEHIKILLSHLRAKNNQIKI